MFLGANNGGQAKAAKGGSGVEGGFPLSCTSADRSRGGGKEDRGASYRPVCGTRGGGGEGKKRKEGRKCGPSETIYGYWKQCCRRPTKGALPFHPSTLCRPNPRSRDGVSRLYGPRLTSHSPFLPSDRIVSPVGPPQGNFPAGATTSDRLSALARFVGKRKRKNNATCFLHIPSIIEIYRCQVRKRGT